MKPNAANVAMRMRGLEPPRGSQRRGGRPGDVAGGGLAVRFQPLAGTSRRFRPFELPEKSTRRDSAVAACRVVFAARGIVLLALASSAGLRGLPDRDVLAGGGIDG